MPITMSPLRYPGGKTQIYKFVNHTMQINRLNKPIYCEPFTGGGGVALSLLLNNDVSSIVLNDLDISIYSFWYAMLYETERFIGKLANVSVDIEEWMHQKDIYMKYLEAESYSFDLGFSAFFLNRTNIAGIIRGGPIGGLSQNSKYSVDCRFNKKILINKIVNIACQRDRIELFNLDATELIEKVVIPRNPTNWFIYFDPPYYQQGGNLYKNSFDHKQHVVLANTMRKIDNCFWITTYDDDSNIRTIYDDRDVYKYTIQYTANKVRKATEILFHSKCTVVEEFDKVKFV